MYHDSRIKKSILNARVNTICYFLNLVISFFSRKIFIDKLGVDFMGLQGTLGSLLSFLNLAELGIGTAIGYVLYQPVYEGDKSKINDIVSVFGYLYRWIGIIIFVSGAILSCFLPLIFPNTKFSLGIIFLGFYAYLFSTLLGYFANYQSVLLSADQRDYEVTGYFQVVQVTKTILQLLLAYFITSFTLFFIVEIVFGAVYSVILNWRIKAIYPWLDTKIKTGRKLLRQYPEIIKYTKQIFVHRMAVFVQYQLMPIIIYGFVSLPIVAIYGNYTTITGKLEGLINGVLAGTTAGIGNMISEGNKEAIYEVYKELLAFRYFIAGVFSSCFYCLSSDFISLWLGKQYTLSPLIVLFVSIILFYNIARNVNEQFINGFGLFYDVWAPIAESIIFLAASIAFGYLLGLAGILLGPILSMTLIVYIWKPYFLYSKGFKISIHKYIVIFFTNIALILLAGLLSYTVIKAIFPQAVDSWPLWIGKAIVFFGIMTVISFILFYFFSQGMKGFIKRLLMIRKI